MKTLRWIVIILSWIFILSSCSQEKCEDDIPTNYSYSVEHHNTIDYCDNYYQELGDSLITFWFLDCDRGRVVNKSFRLRSKDCLIIKL